MSMAENIRTLRLKHGMTQEELGKHLGVQKSAIRKYESGMVKNIPISSIQKMAVLFNVRPSYLMGFDDSSQIEEPSLEKSTSHPPKNYEIFKKNLFQYCKRMALSPVQVFERIGIPSSEYEKWSSENYPSMDSIQKLAKLFHVPIEHLTEDQESAEEQKENLNFLELNGVRFIPVYENVSAGFGVCAIDEVVEYIPLYIVNHQEANETLCIRVRGDSMSPKIEDGDIIQVHKQSSVDSGSIAVVMLDGEEFLVKQVLFGETWIELRSLNPLYKPFRFNGADTERVQIVGLVKKIIKDV